MYVLVKYRTSDAGRIGWLQMDRDDAESLFLNLRRRGVLYWFAVVTYDNIYYYNLGKWSHGLHLAKYC